MVTKFGDLANAAWAELNVVFAGNWMRIKLQIELLAHSSQSTGFSAS